MNDFFKTDYNYIGTKGLVFVGDEVLLYRRDKNAPNYPFCLDVPGGAAEPNETPFQTFKRELNEEFGLKINPDQIVYCRRYQSSLKPNEFGWYAVAKLPSNLKSQIKFGNEGIEYMFMSLNEFLKRKDAWPTYQQRAADYLSSLGAQSTSQDALNC